MKKYIIFLIAGIGILIMPHFSLGATYNKITTGAYTGWYQASGYTIQQQPTSGTLTGAYVQNAQGGAVWIDINGTHYDQTGAVGGSYTWSGLSISFNAGDVVSVGVANGASLAGQITITTNTGTTDLTSWYMTCNQSNGVPTVMYDNNTHYGTFTSINSDLVTTSNLYVMLFGNPVVPAGSSGNSCTDSSLILSYGSPTPPVSLSFVTPTSSQSLPDFSNWLLEFSGFNSTGTAIIEVTGSGVDHFDTENIYTVSTSTTDLSIPKTLALPAGSYTAFASLELPATTTVIATSSISFTINPATLAFTYPTITQTSTGLFDNFHFHASNLQHNALYQVGISWGVTSTPSTAPFLSIVSGDQQSGTNYLWTTSSTDSLNFTLKRPDYSFDFANDVPMWATATLTRTDNCSPGTCSVIANASWNGTLLSIPHSSPSSTLVTGGVVINTGLSNGTSTIQSGTQYILPGQSAILTATSTLDVPSGALILTTTGGFAYYVDSSSTKVVCTPPSDILDVGGGIGYGFCQVINILFNPDYMINTTSFLSDSIAQFKTTPPFSAFWSVAQAVSSTASQASNSTTTGVSIGVLGFNNEHVTLATLNSSTFYNGFTSSNNSSTAKNTMAFDVNYINAWLWIACGIKFLGIFIFT